MSVIKNIEVTGEELKAEKSNKNQQGKSQVGSSAQIKR